MIYCCLSEHKILAFVYALFACVTRQKILFYGEKDPGLPGFLKKRVIIKKDNIGTYREQWYRIQREMVCRSRYMEKMNVESHPFIQRQCRLFQSPKTANFYKQNFAHLEYQLLRNLFLIQNKEGEAICFLLPALRSYRVLASCYLTEQQFVFSRLLTIWYVTAGSIVFLKKLWSHFIFLPVFRKREKALVLKQLSGGFEKFDLSEDLLVDHKKIFSEDILYYMYENALKVKSTLRNALQQARERDYRVVPLGRLFNVNFCLWNHIKYNFFWGHLNLIYVVCRCPSFIFALGIFHEKAAYSYQLYSFCDVSYQWSIGNWHDIAETVIANQCDVKMFMYHWSDNAQSYLYTTTYTVQNDMFLWGPVMEMQFPKSLHDNVYCIGCLFTNSVPIESREKVLTRLGLKPYLPVVAFYDSPPSDDMRHPRWQYDDFLKLVKEFSRNYRDVQVVLKPKTVSDRYREYFRDTNVCLADSRVVSLANILNASTLNVGMGIIAPVVIGLIMKRAGVFYDLAGNYDSPICKYEDTYVFREKNRLLEKIDEVLTTGDIQLPEIEELRDFNVPGADPLAILRDYLVTGQVDEKYRLH